MSMYNYFSGYRIDINLSHVIFGSIVRLLSITLIILHDKYHKIKSKRGKRKWIVKLLLSEFNVYVESLK